jgi:alpha-L-rhamnosidase
MKKALQICCILALGLCTACSRNNILVIPDNLTCNFTECPKNISSDGPRFSWQLTSTLRNQSQSAFRILVSDSQEDINSDTGNIWDSGISTSSRSILVEYAGPELKPAQTYFWKVKVWNQDGVESGWSKVTTFHTALFSMSDWKNAQWITFEEMEEENRLVPGVHGNGDQLDKQAMQRPVVPFFRKDFNITKRIEKAILYISGLGQYEASLNGQ